MAVLCDRIVLLPAAPSDGLLLVALLGQVLTAFDCKVSSILNMVRADREPKVSLLAAG